jgi:hypothetical protein
MWTDFLNNGNIAVSMKNIGRIYGIGTASKNRMNPLGHVERRRVAPQSKHLGLVPAAYRRDEAQIPRQARDDSRLLPEL